MRAALKSLLRSRSFATAVILILGVAIALQTSMVAVVNAYLLRSLPYPESDRLHSITYAQQPVFPPEGLEDLEWAALSDVIEHPIAWDLDMFYLLGGEYPEAAPGAWITWGFTQGLGIRPVLGRAFTENDFVPGQPQVALISDALWRDRYARDPRIVGRTFSAYVSDRPDDPEIFTIVGVLPDGFWHFNPYTQVLTPLRGKSYPYLARLAPDVPAAVAAQRIERLARDANLTVPENWRVEVRPTHAEYTRAARPMLLAVGAAVTIVFLIACANVALLMVLRGMRRRKELAVRMALGAGVGRVARLLLAESIALTAAATAFGLGLAWFTLRTFGPTIEMQLGRRVPGGTAAMTLDWTVLAIMSAALLAVAVILSLAPLAGGRRIFAALRDRRTTSQPAGRHTRSALIVVEVGGSLALLVGCGLMARTVVGLLDVDTGMRVDGLVNASLAMRQQSYPDPAGRSALLERLLTTLRAQHPNVALSTPTPLATYNPIEVTTQSDSGTVIGPTSVRHVTSGYFELIELPIIGGRAISDVDRWSAPPVAVVSQSMARRFWPGANPVGRTVRLVEQRAGRDTAIVDRTVVGVARDARQSPTDADLVDLYVPLTQTAGRFASIVVRTPPTPQAWTSLRRAVSSVDDELAVGTVQDLGEMMSRQLSRPRFLAALFTAFGVFAAVLGAFGLYVVIAYAVKQREHEIAVRMAVGATGQNIVRMVLRDGSWVVVAGLLFGVAGALAVGRLLQAQLFGVQAADIGTIIAATLALALVSFGAVWWPARRASRTDPVVALRAE